MINQLPRSVVTSATRCVIVAAGRSGVRLCTTVAGPKPTLSAALSVAPPETHMPIATSALSPSQVDSNTPAMGSTGTGARVKIRAVASYGLQRVKLPELEKVVRWQPSTQKKWHITPDRDWTLFSLRPDDAAKSDTADPASRKVGHSLAICTTPPAADVVSRCGAMASLCDIVRWVRPEGAGQRGRGGGWRNNSIAVSGV